MVRVIFDGSNLRLSQHHQQMGGGGPIAHFEGLPFQRGYGAMLAARQGGRGVGTVLRALWRYLRPLATSAKPVALGALRELSKEGLESGARALNAIAEGKTVGDAVVAESKEGARRLAEKAVQRFQRGSGVNKRRRRGRPRVTLLPSDVIGKTVPQRALLKRARRDILGTY